MATSVRDFIQKNLHFRQTRLSSLYSDFEKLKTLNPEGFQANIDAWGNLLNQIILQNLVQTSSISIPTHDPDLSQYLSLPIHGRPQSLGLILNELVSSKQLIPLSTFIPLQFSYVDFMTDNQSIFRYLSPNNWLLLLKGDFDSKSKKGLKQERYISWDALKRESLKHLQHLEKKTLYGSNLDILFEKKSLQVELEAKNALSDIDLDILLTHWSRDLNKCTITTKDDKTYIKFSNEPILDEEIGIINLRSSVENLSYKNLQTEVEIEKLDVKLRDLVASKADTPRIKHILRLKKTLSKSLSLSIESYNQLNSIILKIEESNSNLGIYDQLVTGNQLLKSMNSKFDVDEIEDVKEQISEEMAKADEITNVIVGTSEEVDVDEEFDKLLKEVSDKEKDAKKVKQSDDKLLKKLENLNVTSEVEESGELVKTKVPAL